MSKKNYDTPVVKVVAFQVEEGFAGSESLNLKVGNPDATAVFGTQQYTNQSASDDYDWTGSHTGSHFSN